MRHSLPPLAVALLLAGCSPTNSATRSPDSGSTGVSFGCAIDPDCSAEQVCVAGHCQARQAGTDAGPVDAGPPDAGPVDAGHDAGPPDAGHDAGPPDAGPEEDSGPPPTCDEPFDAGSGPFTWDGGGVPAGAYAARDLQDPTSANFGNTHNPDGGSVLITAGPVVVVAPKVFLSGADGGHTCTYGAWVSDPGGGPRSGFLMVTINSRSDGGCDALGGGPIPDDLAVGEVVNVTGSTKEFCYPQTTPCPGDTAVTEIKATRVDRLGTAPVPPPAIVDPSVIGSGGASGIDNQAYDGVLIQVRKSDNTNFAVSDSNPDAPDFFGDWVVDNHLWVHDLYRYRYTPAVGDQIKCLTGVYYYAFGNWKVEPRSGRDLVRP